MRAADMLIPVSIFHATIQPYSLFLVENLDTATAGHSVAHTTIPVILDDRRRLRSLRALDVN
jgi:hypothetical protein